MQPGVRDAAEGDSPMSALTRLRAVAVVALSWGVLWAVVGAGSGLVAMRDSYTLGFLAFFAGFTGVCGTICGAAFAILLNRSRGNGMGFPSVARSAILGAVGAAIVALVLFFPYFAAWGAAWPGARLVVIAAGLGSVSAATLVGLARRTPSRASWSDSPAT